LNRLKRNKGGVSNRMDEAEKERRLKEMMSDAMVNDDIRSRRHKPSSGSAVTGAVSSSGGNDDVEDEGKSGGVSKGSFLREMRSQVYKSETEGGTSMEETLSRTRHYHQKGSDLDSHGFMKR
jgi:hypothetical protein